MDRTGQLWATAKDSEKNNIYVVLDSRPLDGYIEHDIAVFTNGKLVRKDMRVKETKAWELYIQLVRVA